MVYKSIVAFHIEGMVKDMQNFVFRNPTKLIFGKGQLEQLKTEIPQFGKKFFSYTGRQH